VGIGCDLLVRQHAQEGVVQGDQEQGGGLDVWDVLQAGRQAGENDA
jgi:hypothetical protein